MQNTVVIGSGVGGLSCAAHLKRAGVNSTVFEKKDRLGGNCATYDVDGYKVDTGLHYPMPKDIMTFFGLIPDNAIKLVPAVTKLRSNRRDYEITPTNIFKSIFQLKIPILDQIKLTLRLGGLMLKKNSLGREKTMRDVVGYDISPKSEQILNLLTLSACGARIDKASANILSNVLGARTTPIGYPIGGIGALTSNLVKHSKLNVKLNQNVEKIVIKNNKVCGVKVGGRVVPAKRVCCAAPLSEIPSLVGENLDEGLLKKIKKTKAWWGITVWYGTNVKRLGRDFCIINEKLPLAVMSTSSFDSNLAPKGKELVAACTHIDDIKKLNKEKFARKIDKVMDANFDGFLDSVEMRYPQVLRVAHAIQTIDQQNDPLPMTCDVEGLYFANTGFLTEGVGVSLGERSGRDCARLMLNG